MLRVLWDCRFYTIIDVKLGDGDMDTYKYEPMAALLARWEKSRKTNTVSTATTNGEKIAVCSLSGNNAREGSPSSALSIESSRGIEKVRTPFASTGVGKQSNHNCRCEVLFMDDLQISAPQSPAGTGAGLGSGIGNRVGRLN